MKRLAWRKFIVVFCMLWLPAGQALAFNVPGCGLQTDFMHRVHQALHAKAQGKQNVGAMSGCGDQGAFDCMVFTHCERCNAWAVMPSFVLVHASPLFFPVLFHPPSLGQFEPDRIERPPRTVVS